MGHNNLSTVLFSVCCCRLKDPFVQQHNNQQADDFDSLTLRGTWIRLYENSWETRARAASRCQRSLAFLPPLTSVTGHIPSTAHRANGCKQPCGLDACLSREINTGLFFTAAETRKQFFVTLRQPVLKTAVLTKDVWKLDSSGDERISHSFIFHCHPHFLER